ncbi:tetratricopeptide repeat protein [Streptomyces sp. MN03-5084-2B]|nr:tetratricopeptide repeat protein [Streptomyces sp. MN03-5084-2B]
MVARRADELSGLGQWEEAKSAYERHLAVHSDDVDARHGLGIALLSTADLTDAIAEFGRVLDAAPAHFMARYHRAVALGALERYDEAVADFDRLITATPDIWYLWSDRGAVHSRVGRTDDALRDLAEAVRLAPQEGKARLNLGTVLARAGRYAEAHPHLAHAARAGTPGAVKARNSVRRFLFEQADRDDIRLAALGVLAAASGDEVAALAEIYPFVLADEFIELVTGVANGGIAGLRAESWRRVEDLRLLVNDAPDEHLPPSSPTGDPDSYRRLRTKLIELDEKGDHATAYALAPRVVGLAAEQYGIASAEHARQLGNHAVLAMRVGSPDADRLFMAARDALADVDRAALVPLLVSRAAVAPSNARAFAALEEALAVVRDPAAAVEPPDVLRVYRGFGTALMDAHRFTEAEDLLREAVAVTKASGDPLATLCSVLGESIFRQDRAAEAVEWCERALEIRREAHGESHDLVAAAMRDLGLVHRQAGDVGAAESWLRRAIEVWQRLPGRDGEVASAEADLGLLYADAGIAAKARAAAIRARETAGRMRDPQDEVLVRLGEVYQRLGDEEPAREVLERLVELRRTRAPSSAALADAINSLANTHYWAGRHDEALPLYQEALEILRAVDPDDAEAAFALRHNIANVLHREGQVAEAFAAHDAAFAEYRRQRPGDDRKLLHALVAVADLHLRAGHEERAAELLADVQPYLGAHPEVQADAAERFADAEGREWARDLVERAQAALREQRPDEAEHLFGHALRLARADDDVAAMKFGLARARVLRGTSAGVVELLSDSLALRPDDATRVELAGALIRASEHDEARELLVTVVDQGDQQYRGRALSGLGLVAQQTGAIENAQQLFRQALTIADEENAAENRVLARQLLTLALVRTHDLLEAYDVAAAAVHLARSSFGPEHRLTAVAELAFARVLAADGRHTDAETVIRHAYSTLIRTCRPEHPEVVMAMNDLATSLVDQGEPHRAEPWYRRALAANAELNDVTIATIARNLAAAYGNLGDLATARKLLADALHRIHADHPSYGETLAILGQVELGADDHAAAAGHFVEASRLLDATLGPEHESSFTVKGHLAELYLRIGARDTALSFAAFAERVARARYGPHNAALAPHIANLARCRAFTGDPAEAERLYRQALDLVPSSRRYLSALTELQIATGARDDALATIQRLIAQEEEELPRILSRATESHRAARFAELERVVDAYLTLVVAGDDPEPAMVRHAWELTVRYRGLDAEFLALRKDTPDSAELRHDLAQVRADIGRAVLSNTVDALPHLRERRDELERILAARVPGHLLADRIGKVDIDAVIAALPVGTALIDVVRTQLIDFDNVALGRPLASGSHELDRTWLRPPARYLAFVITSVIHVIDLGDADSIDEQVEHFRASLYRRSPDAAAAEALRTMLLAPVLRNLSAERLLVVTNGPLTGLPWQVLPTGPDHLLVDNHTVSYLSSPREVLRWRPQEATTPSIVLGDPDFDLDITTRRHGMRRLPATEIECTEVAGLLGVEPLLHREAVKSAVLAARSPHVLHLATHGLFLPSAKPPEKDDVYSQVHLLDVPGEGRFVLQAERRRPDRPNVDPLLSSGLALAGFNAWLGEHPTPPGTDTGVLTAEEVCTLDLRGTRLVVLSACETGLGNHRPGEGTVGLRWAFAVAGARAIATTLWKVPDVATRELMVLFYERLLADEPIPDALRSAQQRMRARGHDITVWGAFVAHGEPAGILHRLPTHK